jgi:predicted RNA-binding Zn ribbon-like protein
VIAVTQERSSQERPTDHRGRYVPDGSWPTGREAPEPLERVRRFLNTANSESGADHFETAATLQAWLEREGYDARRLSGEDHGRLLELRAAVRELCLDNHDRAAGGSSSDGDAGAVDVLRRLGAGAPVVVRLSADPGLVPVSTGADAVIATLLAAVHDAMVAGTWERMKACRNHHCRWVFYDHSRNASGAWCSVKACGSRMKVRAYRARKRAGTAATAAATRTGLLALTSLVGLVVAACGSSGDDSDSGGPAAPEGSFCEVVSAWSDGVTGTVNHFSLESADVADVAARRQLYLEAWDGLGHLASWIDEAAERAPQGTEDQLRDAAVRVREEVALGREASVALPDSNYEAAAVSDGTLFKVSEKSRSLVFRTLDELRVELGDGTVPRRCGREPKVVSLPVMTPP